MGKPSPRVVSEVCSVCGLDWKQHGKAPTLETCVRLLLDEVRAKDAALARRPVVIDRPYPVYPPLRPAWPYWYTTWGGSTSTGNAARGSITAVSRLAPQAVNTTNLRPLKV